MNVTEESVAPLADRIDALLPQTQCTRCGYAGCRPYAEAVAAGAAGINRCPPGGTAGIAALSRVLGVAPTPLDPDCGPEGALAVAWIDAPACIGCARCLPACPVDAILGARHFLHTVLPADCNGCELCVAVCPVDCISMQPRPSNSSEPSAADNRRRHGLHRSRLRRAGEERARLLAERKGYAQPTA